MPTCTPSNVVAGPRTLQNRLLSDSVESPLFGAGHPGGPGSQAGGQVCRPSRNGHI
jgi:hypothetical protein